MLAIAAYAGSRRTLPLSRDTIVYESFQGGLPTCNPLALFRELSGNSGMGATHIWSVRSELLTAARDLLGANTGSSSGTAGKVRLVATGSAAYYRALATAGILINNVTFPRQFRKRAGQRYLNTWHGTPLKRIGRDTNLSEQALANTMANMAAADVVLSTSPFMSTHLESAFNGPKIAELGYPRIDQQFDAQLRRQTRELLGVESDQRLVLYAPTWREAGPHTARDSSAEIARVVAAISGSGADVKIFFSAHHLIAAHTSANPELSRHSAPLGLDTNQLLGAVDVLVTDYSSVLFDYLATGSQLIRFVPDLDEYSGTRGLYLSSDQTPGVATGNLSELAQWVAGDRLIGAITQDQRVTFAPHGVGAAGRVIDQIVEPWLI